MSQRAHRRKRREALLLALLCGACTVQEVVGPSTRRPVLLGAVVQGMDSVRVAIGRAGAGVSSLPVSDAAMVLIYDGHESAFEQVSVSVCAAPDGFSCYVAVVDRSLAPGSTLELTGTASTVGFFSASTTLPGLPAIAVEGQPNDDPIKIESLETTPEVALQIAGGPNAVVLGGQVEGNLPAIVWTNQGRASCSLRPSLPLGLDLRSFARPGSGGVTELGLSFGSPACPHGAGAAWDSLQVELPFLQYDENLTKSLRLPAPVLDDAPAFGTQGIHGFFGSATRRVWRLRFVRRDSSSP